MNKAEERIIFGDISNEPEEVFIEEDAQIINWQGGSFEVSESSLHGMTIAYHFLFKLKHL